MTRGKKAFVAYWIALLLGFVIAKLPNHGSTYFYAYLIAFFLFTGALPYLGDPIPDGAPGKRWQSLTKLIYPVIAAGGIALIAKLLFLARG